MEKSPVTLANPASIIKATYLAAPSLSTSSSVISLKPSSATPLLKAAVGSSSAVKPNKAKLKKKKVKLYLGRMSSESSLELKVPPSLHRNVSSFSSSSCEAVPFPELPSQIASKSPNFNATTPAPSATTTTAVPPPPPPRLSASERISRKRHVPFSLSLSDSVPTSAFPLSAPLPPIFTTSPASSNNQTPLEGPNVASKNYYFNRSKPSSSLDIQQNNYFNLSSDSEIRSHSNLHALANEAEHSQEELFAFGVSPSKRLTKSLDIMRHQSLMAAASTSSEVKDIYINVPESKTVCIDGGGQIEAEEDDELWLRNNRRRSIIPAHLLLDNITILEPAVAERATSRGRSRGGTSGSGKRHSDSSDSGSFTLLQRQQQGGVSHPAIWKKLAKKITSSLKTVILKLIELN